MLSRVFFPSSRFLFIFDFLFPLFSCRRFSVSFFHRRPGTRVVNPDKTAGRRRDVEKRLPTQLHRVRGGARPVHGTVPGDASDVDGIAGALLVGDRGAVPLGDAVRRRQLLLVQLRRGPRARACQVDGRGHDERVLQPAGQERPQRDGRQNRVLLVSNGHARARPFRRRRDSSRARRAVSTTRRIVVPHTVDTLPRLRRRRSVITDVGFSPCTRWRSDGLDPCL